MASGSHHNLQHYCTIHWYETQPHSDGLCGCGVNYSCSHTQRNTKMNMGFTGTKPPPQTWSFLEQEVNTLSGNAQPVPPVQFRPPHSSPDLPPPAEFFCIANYHSLKGGHFDRSSSVIYFDRSRQMPGWAVGGTGHPLTAIQRFRNNSGPLDWDIQCHWL